MLATSLVCLAVGSKLSVLVFSKTAGFRHDSIPTAIEAMQKVAKERSWKIEASEDSAIFTDKDLKRFDVVVFMSTTGDILNTDQEKALENFVESGGGYVGVHAASDTEYGWDWYGRLVGAYFSGHPHIQDASIKVEDRNHVTTLFLPEVWKRHDEWYNFRPNPRNKVKVLASLDESTYQGGNMNGDHPTMWYQEVGKGRSWYTGGGHTRESFLEPLFMRTVAEAVAWAGAKHRSTMKNPTR